MLLIGAYICLFNIICLGSCLISIITFNHNRLETLNVLIRMLLYGFLGERISYWFHLQAPQNSKYGLLVQQNRHSIPHICAWTIPSAREVVHQTWIFDDISDAEFVASSTSFCKYPTAFVWLVIFIHVFVSLSHLIQHFLSFANYGFQKTFSFMWMYNYITCYFTPFVQTRELIYLLFLFFLCFLHKRRIWMFGLWAHNICFAIRNNNN